jgi:diguanylate cyclase (GGDEF)-like protein
MEIKSGAVPSNFSSVIEDYLNNLTGLVIIVLDRQKNVLECNSAFRRLIDLPEKPHGRNIADFMPPGAAGSMILNSNKTGQPMECRLRFLSGKSGDLVLKSFLFSDEDKIILLGEREQTAETSGSPGIALAEARKELAQKTSALEKAKSRIKELKRIDSLTGLLNRRSFHEVFNSTFSYTIRHNQPLSLSVVDLDCYCSINEQYGHEMGDRVLLAFSGILQSMMRTEDIVCRFGGEEFILLIPGTKAEEVSVLVERICRTSREFQISGFDGKITATFGIAQLAQTDTFESLLKRAQEALCEAKSSGEKWFIK